MRNLSKTAEQLEVRNKMIKCTLQYQCYLADREPYSSLDAYIHANKSLPILSWHSNLYINKIPTSCWMRCWEPPPKGPHMVRCWILQPFSATIESRPHRSVTWARVKLDSMVQRDSRRSRLFPLSLMFTRSAICSCGKYDNISNTNYLQSYENTT